MRRMPLTHLDHNVSSIKSHSKFHLPTSTLFHGEYGHSLQSNQATPGSIGNQSTVDNNLHYMPHTLIDFAHTLLK